MTTLFLAWQIEGRLGYHLLDAAGWTPSFPWEMLPWNAFGARQREHRRRYGALSHALAASIAVEVGSNAHPIAGSGPVRSCGVHGHSVDSLSSRTFSLLVEVVTYVLPGDRGSVPIHASQERRTTLNHRWRENA